MVKCDCRDGKACPFCFKKKIKKERANQKKKESNLHLEIFELQLSKFGIKKPEKEFKFCKNRKWRFDLCWPSEMLAMEIEGGIWTNGRHVRGSGFIKDMEKYNKSAILGYHLLRVTPNQIKNGEAVSLVIEFFKYQKT